MDSRGERDFVGKVIRHEAHRQLALTVGLLIDRGGNDALVKIGGHFSKQVGSY